MTNIRYELIYLDAFYDIVTKYFESNKEIFNFLNNAIFDTKVIYFISCYDYKNHKYIYI